MGGGGGKGMTAGEGDVGVVLVLVVSNPSVVLVHWFFDFIDCLID